MGAPTKYDWSDIFAAVRQCRALAGDTEPSRIAVEGVVGGADVTRIMLAIRAVEAEYGFRPEFLDTLTPKLLAFVTDPRKPGGRLPIPAELLAVTPEPFLSAMITMFNGIEQTRSEFATSAAALIADAERAAQSRVTAAEQITTDHAQTIASQAATIIDLRQQLEAAAERAHRAEAARDAYKAGKKSLSGLETKIAEVYDVVMKKRAPTRPRPGSHRRRGDARSA